MDQTGAGWRHRLTSAAMARGVIAALVLIGALLRLQNATNVASRTPDERVYTHQATVLQQEGIGGVRRLADEYLKNESSALYPPPYRVGYTWPVAAIMSVTGPSDAQAGAWLSTSASIATLGLVAWIGWTFFTPWTAAGAVLLLGVFPPDLVVSRRAWPDALVSGLTCLMMLCALSIARRARPVGEGRPRLALPLLLFAGAVFVLTKEAALIVWALCASWVVVRQRMRAVPAVLLLAITGTVAVALLFWVVGGMSTFVAIQSRMPEAHLRNEYALDFQNGPAFWLLLMFWVSSPWTTVLAVVGILASPFFPYWRDRASVVAMAGFAAVFLLLPFVTPNWLNLRYASPVFGPLCLLAASALRTLFEILRRQLPSQALPALAFALSAGAAGIAIGDRAYFEHWFVETETADLSAGMVLPTRGFVVPRASRSNPRAGLLSEQPSQPGPSVPATARQRLDESFVLFQQKRFEESIAVANQAIALYPEYAEAFNNIAAAYEELGQWDEAIAAAEEAVRLKPDFTLARNNLAWSRAQKAREAAQKR